MILSGFAFAFGSYAQDIHRFCTTPVAVSELILEGRTTRVMFPSASCQFFVPRSLVRFVSS